MSKFERFSFHIEPSQRRELVELKEQTNVDMAEIIRRLFRFLPQIRQELIEEARKRLNNDILH